MMEIAPGIGARSPVFSVPDGPWRFEIEGEGADRLTVDAGSGEVVDGPGPVRLTIRNASEHPATLVRIIGRRATTG
ncbi:MAG: hypothetical protein H5U40_14335 [Polyangiaceae bacterium]|nr:hypothetical protein [Polyangiaceae bacterium]